MSTNTEENNSNRGITITYETIAKGQIRTKVKFWVDFIDINEAAQAAAQLYEQALKEIKSKGFKVEGEL